MSAAASAARARSIRRRSSSARLRESSARPVKWTSDRMEDLASTSQAFDEIVDAELGARPRRQASLALRADVIGDVGAYSIYPWTAALEPVQVVSFLPGPYRIDALSRAGRRRRDLESADRAVSRRRPADLDLRDGAADRHGGRARLGIDPKEHPPAQSRAAATSFPTRSAPASCGTSRASSECLRRACDAIGYEALRDEQARRAPTAAGSASASPAMRN